MNLSISDNICLPEGRTLHVLKEMWRRHQNSLVAIPLGRGRLCVGTGQGAASVFELLN